MIDKNELMKEEVKRLMVLVNSSEGETKEDYKKMVKDIMDTLLKKDWQLMDECQNIINEMYKN